MLKRVSEKENLAFREIKIKEKLKTKEKHRVVQRNSPHAQYRAEAINLKAIEIEQWDHLNEQQNEKCISMFRNFMIYLIVVQ